MEKLLVFKPDLTPFDPDSVEQAFRSSPGFSHLRTNEPGGALIECQFCKENDWTFVRLSGDAETIVIDHSASAALHAVFLIQKYLRVPLRMVNDDNNFDLTFSDIVSVEELEAAIDNARTS